MRTFLYALTSVSLGLASAQSIVTVAGLPYSHRQAVDGKPALSAPLGNVYGLLIDKLTGRLLLHDQGMVFRLEPDGSLISIVGIGRGFDGSTVNGTLASGFNTTAFRGMAQDASGALYLAEAGLGRVDRVGPDGVVTRFAGGGTNFTTASSDGGQATDASISSPRGLVFDSHGNLDIVEVFCHCIRQVSPAGIISTVFTLPAQATPFIYFEGLAIDAQDNLYAAEYGGSKVWKIAPDGSAAVIAGTGVPGFSGDGGPATAAQLSAPSGVTVSSNGDIYIADTGNQRVRRIAPDGTISTFAGTGASGFSGDGGLATDARLFLPAQTLIDAAGNILIADYANRRVRMVSAEGIISTLAGSGIQDLQPVDLQHVGDGGPALNAFFNTVTSAAFDPTGNLFVADSNNQRIRKITPDGAVTTVAGTGATSYSGEGGPGTQAAITRPITVVTDTAGAVYFETGDSRVLKVTPDGIMHLVAGSGPSSALIRSGGDGGPAVDATLSLPKGLAVDAKGNVYIADTSNARLRKVDTNGIITTIAGPGRLGQDYWNALAFDPQGNLYVAITHVENGNYYSVVDRVNSDKTLTPVAGNAQPCFGTQGPPMFTFDGAQVMQATLCTIVGLTFDAQGNMYIPESFYNIVLKVSPDGTVRRVAGSGTNNDLGDGGSPLLANLNGAGTYYAPPSVAVDPQGNLLLPQSGANRIRMVMPDPIKLRSSRDRIDFQSRQLQSQSFQISANAAEPLPFGIKISTNSGGAWLITNRVTGQTGDTLTLSANTSGLAPGVYTATVQVALSAAGSVGAAVQVTLTVQ